MCIEGVRLEGKCSSRLNVDNCYRVLNIMVIGSRPGGIFVTHQMSVSIMLEIKRDTLYAFTFNSGSLVDTIS